MEWAAAIISGIAAGVSVYAAWRATAADRKRAEGRRLVGHAIDAGNQLVADLRAERFDEAEAKRRHEEWEDSADAAVRKADKPQIGRYHAEIVGVTKRPGVIQERLKRLQEILDRL